MKLYFFLISISAAIAAIALFASAILVYDNGNIEDAIVLFISFAVFTYVARLFRNASLEADDDAKAADKVQDA